MKRFVSVLAVWAAALWWGSLTTVGFYVVPLLFAYLPSPALAGSMAARLFSAQTWVAVGCGLCLLLAARSDESARPAPGAASAWIVLNMLLALLSEFAVAPHIVARENLRLWHSLGSGMYLLQWLCAGWVFWKLRADEWARPEVR